MDGAEESSSTYNVDIFTGNVIFTPTASSGDSSATTGTWSSTSPSYITEMPPPPNPDVPSNSKTSLGKIKPPSRGKIKELPPKDSEEYLKRRQRNNVAVRKSREKTREKSAYTLQKVDQLKMENEQLESKISILTKELSVLKDLFMDHARGFGGAANSVHLSPDQLEQLLGCKAIRDNSVTMTSTSEATITVVAEPAQSCSTIQPLINVAEIELQGLKDNQTFASNSGSVENGGGIHNIDEISWTSADPFVTVTLETEES